MGDKYAECNKTHAHLSWKTDGCMEFEDSGLRFACEICGCHRNFHRKVDQKPITIKDKPELVYTKCAKIHEFKCRVSVDGCQEFMPVKIGPAEVLTSAACGCHKNFHQKGDPAKGVHTRCDKIHVFKTTKVSVDGCLEFISSGKEGTQAALKCFHCGCHKGFHRKVEAVYTVSEDT